MGSSKPWSRCHESPYNCNACVRVHACLPRVMWLRSTSSRSIIHCGFTCHTLFSVMHTHAIKHNPFPHASRWRRPIAQHTAHKSVHGPHKIQFEIINKTCAMCAPKTVCVYIHIYICTDFRGLGDDDIADDDDDDAVCLQHAREFAATSDSENAPRTTRTTATTTTTTTTTTASKTWRRRKKMVHSRTLRSRCAGDGRTRFACVSSCVHNPKRLAAGGFCWVLMPLRARSCHGSYIHKSQRIDRVPMNNTRTRELETQT